MRLTTSIEWAANRLTANRLTANVVTGWMQVLFALTLVDRPSSSLNAWIVEHTHGDLNSYGMAALFVVCGLYQLLRRPRPNALWSFVATLPLLGYSIATALYVFDRQEASWAFPVLAFGYLLTLGGMAVRASRRERTNGI